jgi:hypothetical protein
MCYIASVQFTKLCPYHKRSWGRRRRLVWPSRATDCRGWQKGWQNEYFKYNLFSSVTNFKLCKRIFNNDGDLLNFIICYAWPLWLLAPGAKKPTDATGSYILSVGKKWLLLRCTCIFSKCLFLFRTPLALMSIYCRCRTVVLESTTLQPDIFRNISK